MTNSTVDRQQGVALIVVLLVMTLIAVLAVSAMQHTRFTTFRIANQSKLEQMYWYAMGVESLVQKVLSRDLKQATTNLEQEWATRRFEFAIEDGSIRSRIVDLNSCFNLNALRKGPATGNKLALPHRQFLLLLNEVGIAEVTADKLRVRVKDWIDSDTVPTGLSGKEFGYSIGGQAYQPPNEYIHDISELALISELSPSTITALKDVLCSLPADYSVQININTLTDAHSALLSAMLSQKITTLEAADIIAQRPIAGFESMDQVWSLPLLREKELTDDEKASFAKKSRYFRADTEVHYHGARRYHHTWLKYSGNRVKVIARQYGDRL